MTTHRLYRSIAGHAQAFRRSLASARAVQHARLASILSANASTRYGARYDFAGIRSVADYQARVPVVRYDDLAPAIDAMAEGEPDLLVPGRPIAFEETGGSTAGPKRIPYTPALLESFRRGLLPWLDDLAVAYPAIATGSAYWAISPAARPARSTPGGIPIGLGSDAAYFGESLAPLVLETLAVPPDVGVIASIDRWRDETCRHLAACKDLALISVWSPTFLGPLADRVALAPAVISCWDQAGARPYAEALRRRFPSTRVQGKGLLATEGLVSIPLEGLDWPVLAVDSGFYEFLDDAGRAHDIGELATGVEYEIAMTTEGGLYRYAIGDRVRVRGWVDEAPLLEFIGRAAMVDLVGEKLTEAFVAAALAPIGLTFAHLAPVRDGRLGYRLTVDAEEVVEAESEALAAKVETALRANPQYDYARRLGQLAELEIARRPRPLDAWIARGLARGQRLGDIKPPTLAHEPL